MGFDEMWDQINPPQGGSAGAPAPSMGSFDAIWDAVNNGGASTTAPSFGESVWIGVKNSPRNALDMLSDIPSAAQNIFSSIFSPKESLKSGVLEKTVRGTGTMAAGLAGAGAGGTVGAELGLLGGPLAPITVPVGTVAGAALGGASALMGYDWLNQLTGSDAPTTPQQDVQKLGENTGTGLVFGTVGEGLKAGSSLLEKPLTETANALDRKSIGARQSDYGKASDTRTVHTPEGAETQVKSYLDDLATEGKFGTSRSPSKVMASLEAEAEPLRNAINDIIQNYDATSNVPAHPDFSGSLNYLASGKVPADLVDTYLARLENLNDAIKLQGGGKLSYLQQQKVALGKSYDPADKVLSGFNRAIYNDLKNSIEKYAPEVGPLNQELAKYQVAEPIVTRSLKASENASPLSKLASFGYTTGGVSAPAIVGGLTAGAPGAVLGGILGTTTKALASPTGQALAARGLRAASKGPSMASRAVLTGGAEAENNQKLNDVFGKIFKSKKAPSMGKLPESSKSEGAISQVFSSPKKQDISATEAEIRQNPVDLAIYMTESNAGKNLKNPTSSAKGGFQLIDDTARRLGVKDPMTLAENYGAYKKLRDSTIEKFGNDPIIIYASHLLGEPTLKKVLENKPLNERETAAVEQFLQVLPRYKQNLAMAMNQGGLAYGS